MKRFLRENGLSVAFVVLILAAWIGQSVVGHRQYNEEQEMHGQPTVTWAQYLKSGEFLESSAENWESEFLQMAALIWLTRFLRQRGSEMSKPFDQEEEQDKDPRTHARADSPKAVLRGGLALKIYEKSLTLTLLGLFLVSFVLHGVGGWMLENEENQEHGQPTVTLLKFMVSSAFWFQSLQNWQSEFMACGAIILLTIFLRQKGSPESKPVYLPHGESEGG